MNDLLELASLSLLTVRSTASERIRDPLGDLDLRQVLDLDGPAVYVINPAHRHRSPQG